MTRFEKMFCAGSSWATLALITAAVAAGPVGARADGILLPWAADVARVLILSPGVAVRPDETHAALLVSRESYYGRTAFAGRVRTVKQLRTGSLPNPWECAWLVWNYQDDQNFYYVALKPAGWEIGKRDPIYPGGQRFLASGEDEFPLGAWHDFLIVQDKASITIRLNGAMIAAVADSERPLTGGRLGLYTEDAEVELGAVTAPFRDDFAGQEPVTGNTDGFVLDNWVTPFLGFGYVAIVDRIK
jgi:hypothetical protein